MFGEIATVVRCIRTGAPLPPKPEDAGPNTSSSNNNNNNNNYSVGVTAQGGGGAASHHSSREVSRVGEGGGGEETDKEVIDAALRANPNLQYNRHVVPFYLAQQRVSHRVDLYRQNYKGSRAQLEQRVRDATQIRQEVAMGPALRKAVSDAEKEVQEAYGSAEEVPYRVLKQAKEDAVQRVLQTIAQPQRMSAAEWKALNAKRQEEQRERLVQVEASRTEAIQRSLKRHDELVAAAALERLAEEETHRREQWASLIAGSVAFRLFRNRVVMLSFNQHITQYYEIMRDTFRPWCAKAAQTVAERRVRERRGRWWYALFAARLLGYHVVRKKHVAAIIATLRLRLRSRVVVTRVHEFAIGARRVQQQIRSFVAFRRARIALLLLQWDATEAQLWRQAIAPAAAALPSPHSHSHVVVNNKSHSSFPAPQAPGNVVVAVGAMSSDSPNNNSNNNPVVDFMPSQSMGALSPLHQGSLPFGSSGALLSDASINFTPIAAASSIAGAATGSAFPPKKLDHKSEDLIEQALHATGEEFLLQVTPSSGLLPFEAKLKVVQHLWSAHFRTFAQHTRRAILEAREQEELQTNPASRRMLLRVEEEDDDHRALHPSSRKAAALPPHHPQQQHPLPIGSSPVTDLPPPHATSTKRAARRSVRLPFFIRQQSMVFAVEPYVAICADLATKTRQHCARTVVVSAKESLPKDLLAKALLPASVIELTRKSVKTCLEAIYRHEEYARSSFEELYRTMLHHTPVSLDHLHRVTQLVQAFEERQRVAPVAHPLISRAALLRTYGNSGRISSGSIGPAGAKDAFFCGTSKTTTSRSVLLASKIVPGLRTTKQPFGEGPQHQGRFVYSTDRVLAKLNMESDDGLQETLEQVVEVLQQWDEEVLQLAKVRQEAVEQQKMLAAQAAAQRNGRRGASASPRK